MLSVLGALDPEPLAGLLDGAVDPDDPLGAEVEIDRPQRDQLTHRRPDRCLSRMVSVITEACAEDGLFIYAVHERRIERLDLQR